jgi:ABC-type branched-subunit amino acid transport system substrate-binding protein
MPRLTRAPWAQQPIRPRRGAPRRAYFAAAAVALAVAGLAACSSSGGGGGSGGSGGSAAGGTINICEIEATTGAFEVNGVGNAEGTAAWAKAVNAKGGLLGNKVKLTVENDNSDPATAATLVRKCVTQDGANFIFGPENTATGADAIPVANQLKVITLVENSGWSDIGLTTAEQHGYAFPAHGDSFQTYAALMISDVIVPDKLTRVAVLQNNQPDDDSVGPYVAAQGAKDGFTVVDTESVQPGSTDDTPQVLKMLQAKPQAIVLGLNPGADALTGLKAIRAQNPTIPVGVCPRCSASSFISSMGGGTAMENTFMVGTPEQLASASLTGASSALSQSVSDTKSYLAALKAAGTGSEDSIAEDGSGWDAGQELENAIQTAKSTSTAAVLSALQHQTVTVGGQNGTVFARSPQNYANISQVIAAVATVNKSGTLTLFKIG